MFDIRWIRENAEAFDAALGRRGVEPQAERLLGLDDNRRTHVTKLQEAQETRNAASKEIGRAKASGDEEAARQATEQVAKLKSFIQSGEEEEKNLSGILDASLSELPNIPFDNVPTGADENDNVEYRTYEEKKNYVFEDKEHFEIDEALG